MAASEFRGVSEITDFTETEATVLALSELLSCFIVDVVIYATNTQGECSRKINVTKTVTRTANNQTQINMYVVQENRLLSLISCA